MNAGILWPEKFWFCLVTGLFRLIPIQILRADNQPYLACNRSLLIFLLMNKLSIIARLAIWSPASPLYVVECFRERHNEQYVSVYEVQLFARGWKALDKCCVFLCCKLSSYPFCLETSILTQVYYVSSNETVMSIFTVVKSLIFWLSCNPTVLDYWLYARIGWLTPTHQPDTGGACIYITCRYRLNSVQPFPEFLTFPDFYYVVWIILLVYSHRS